MYVKTVDIEYLALAKKAINKAKSLVLTGRANLECPNCSVKNCLNIRHGLWYVGKEEVLIEPRNKELRISPNSPVGDAAEQWMDSPRHWWLML